MHVIVIGAGIIGAAIADLLARRGADVTILEMRAPGRGASQASAGILAPYTEAHQHSPLLELGARSLALYDSFIRGLVERTGRAVEYARSGTLEVAFDDEHAQPLRASADWLRARGIEHQWLNAEEIRTVEPSVSAAAVGGLLIPAHGFVAVRPLVTALLHSARFHGAVLQTQSEVGEITAAADHVELSSRDRRWRADSVVVAAGSWTKAIRIKGGSPVPTRPIRGQLLHLRWSGANPPGRVVWGPECYVVPSTDGSLLVGATMEDVGFDERTTVDGVTGLLHAAVRLLPAAATASLEGVRVGLRPQVGELPVIGPLPGMPRVTIATGHYRNGVLLAPVTAEIVASHVLEGREDSALAFTAPAPRPI